jgi:pSer/pThr/pTyr-binding forkhead associated (FHA) protein
MDGALFCAECGAYVFHDADSDVTLKVAAAQAVGSEVSTRPLDYRLGFGIKADRIIFVIPSSGRRLEVDLGQAILIGRMDTRQGIWPEVDLTLDEGAEKGVSRNHAMVRTSDEGVVLVDLGSTNGTRINDRRLSPERPHLLRNGDAVRFGNLLVRVYLET